jgi:hypothetical protein
LLLRSEGGPQGIRGSQGVRCSTLRTYLRGFVINVCSLGQCLSPWPITRSRTDRGLSTEFIERWEIGPGRAFTN